MLSSCSAPPAPYERLICDAMAGDATNLAPGPAEADRIIARHGGRHDPEPGKECPPR
jgi:hypothetical protein